MHPARVVVRFAGVLVGLVGLVGTAAACGSPAEEFPDDTARVGLFDRSHELEVLSCGRDEERDVFVLAASSADAFLQLLLTVEDGGVDTAASAISFESRGLGVFGAGDGALLKTPPGQPGTIDLASIRGDRIDVEADVAPIGNDDTAASTGGRLDLVARCAGAGDVASGARRPGGRERTPDEVRPPIPASACPRASRPVARSCSCAL